MGSDGLVPAFFTNVEMHPVRPDELLIRCGPGRTNTARVSPIAFHVWHIRGLQFGDGRPLIVDHEPDMVDAAEIHHMRFVVDDQKATGHRTGEPGCTHMKRLSGGCAAWGDRDRTE